VIPTIITQALSGRAIQLGSLTPTRDLNYVEDTVAGFIAAARADKAIGEVINLGRGEEISIGELAKLILALMGKDLPICCEELRLRPEGSEVERLCADNRKAAEFLNWQPRVSLKEGLQKTIRWMELNLERYRITQYAI